MTLLGGRSGSAQWPLGDGGLVGCAGGQGFDLVRAEPGPVVTVGEDDGRLLVAQGLHRLQRLGICADIHDGVLQPVLVQRPVGRVALHTRRFAENSDAHRLPLSLGDRSAAGRTGDSAINHDRVTTSMFFESNTTPCGRQLMSTLGVVSRVSARRRVGRVLHTSDPPSCGRRRRSCGHPVRGLVQIVAKATVRTFHPHPQAFALRCRNFWLHRYVHRLPPLSTGADTPERLIEPCSSPPPCRALPTRRRGGGWVVVYSLAPTTDTPVMCARSAGTRVRRPRRRPRSFRSDEPPAGVRAAMRQTVANAPMIAVRESLASPNRTWVRSANSNSLSMPANPGRMERLRKITWPARSASMMGMP